jgi:hypothetical protein
VNIAFSKTNINYKHLIYASAVTGILCGGTIKNVTIDGRIDTINNAAGFVGRFRYGTIENCINYAYISVLSILTESSYAAGILCICEYSGGIININNCKNYGTITGEYLAGGICTLIGNFINADITKCENYGDIYVSAENVSEGVISSLNHYAAGITSCVFPECKINYILCANYGNIYINNVLVTNHNYVAFYDFYNVEIIVDGIVICHTSSY